MSSIGPNQAPPGYCIHCLVKPAQANRKYEYLATLFCSDRHRVAFYAKRKFERQRASAERVRQLLGLPMGRGKDLSAPELEAIVRRLERVLPYDGAVMYPAGHRRRGKRQGPRERAS